MIMIYFFKKDISVLLSIIPCKIRQEVFTSKKQIGFVDEINSFLWQLPGHVYIQKF